jgi:hypothetical protein
MDMKEGYYGVAENLNHFTKAIKKLSSDRKLFVAFNRFLIVFKDFKKELNRYPWD